MSLCIHTQIIYNVEFAKIIFNFDDTLYCTTLTNLCSVRLNSEISGTLKNPAGGTRINGLFRTVQTCPVAQLAHRKVKKYKVPLSEKISLKSSK